MPAKILFALGFLTILSLFWVNNFKTEARFYNNSELIAGFTRAQDSAFIAHHSAKLGVNLDTNCNRVLISFISDWLGVSYRRAGYSKSGIDCSGFVSKTYFELFCVSLPHSSSAMLSHIKARVPKSELKEGDILFFKIHKSVISHVGIYLKDNKFIHASPGRGIVVDDLRQDYYKRYYFAAGRIL